MVVDHVFYATWRLPFPWQIQHLCSFDPWSSEYHKCLSDIGVMTCVDNSWDILARIDEDKILLYRSKSFNLFWRETVRLSATREGLVWDVEEANKLSQRCLRFCLLFLDFVPLLFLCIWLLEGTFSNCSTAGQLTFASILKSPLGRVFKWSIGWSPQDLWWRK